MLHPISLDKFLRWTVITLILAAVFFTLKALSEVLLPFFIAWLLAYLLYPVVKFIQYKMHVTSRAISIILTFILIIAIIAGIVFIIVPPFISEMEKLEVLANKYIQSNTHSNNIAAMLKQWFTTHRFEINHFLKSRDFTDAIKTAMPQVFALLGQTANVVFSVIASFITLLYMFFILLDYESLGENFFKMIPRKWRSFSRVLASDVEKALNSYIRGQGMVALCMAIMFCIGFSIIDFPMAIGLGILIGILDLVPYLHALALIPTAILALMKAADTGHNFWMIFGGALLVFIIVQIITDMIITPKIMGKAMGLNPAMLLLSLSIWGALLGFIGLIIALPLTTIIIAYWKRYVTKDEEVIKNK